MVGTDVRLVVVTAPDEPVAAKLCRTLVSERLVACGNIVPAVRSIYRWEGRLEDEPEFLLLLKTVKSKVPDLLRRVPELHPYEVPEVLVLGIEAGHQPYLDWVAREIGSGGSR